MLHERVQRRLTFPPSSDQANVERLKEYKSKLVLFPRRAGKAKVRSPFLSTLRDQFADKPFLQTQSGDATAEDIKAVSDSTHVTRGAVLPIRKPVPVVGSVAVTAEMKATKAYATLRLERMNARLVGALCVRSTRITFLCVAA